MTSWAVVRFGVVLSLSLFALAGCESKPGAGALVLSKDDGAKPLVLGGNRERDDTDPAVVAVLMSSGACTGTLIAPRFVLTARHCVSDGAPVAVSWRSRAFAGKRTPARVHLMSASLGYADDIAVLELAEASTVTPIPVNLNPRGLDRLSQIRVVGYGLSGSNNDDGGVKRTATARAFLSRSFVESSQPSVCYGDSGGPALAMIDGREHVVGVTSHHLGRHCEDGRSRFVRTDAHRAFLAKFVSDAAPTPRPRDKNDNDNIAGNPEPRVPDPRAPEPRQDPPPRDRHPRIDPRVPNGDGDFIVGQGSGAIIIGKDGSIRISGMPGIPGGNGGIGGSIFADDDDDDGGDDDDEAIAPGDGGDGASKRGARRGHHRHPKRSIPAPNPHPSPDPSFGAVPKKPMVTIYSADYCGACKTAKAWLTANQIPFVERRVDTDPRANADYNRLGGTGLPTYEIAGNVHSGHDPAWVLRTIRNKSATAQQAPRRPSDRS